MNILIIAVIFIYFFYKCLDKKEEVNILIENSIKRYYQIPKNQLICRKKNKEYSCNLLFETNKKADGIIYNGNLHYIRYNSNYSRNVIMASEKVSQVKHMIDIKEKINILK